MLKPSLPNAFTRYTILRKKKDGTRYEILMELILPPVDLCTDGQQHRLNDMQNEIKPLKQKITFLHYPTLSTRHWLSIWYPAFVWNTKYKSWVKMRPRNLDLPHRTIITFKHAQNKPSYRRQTRLRKFNKVWTTTPWHQEKTLTVSDIYA